LLTGNRRQTFPSKKDMGKEQFRTAYEVSQEASKTWMPGSMNPHSHHWQFWNNHSSRPYVDRLQSLFATSKRLLCHF